MTNDLWIEWNGGECPVEEGTLVDVKYRDGYVEMCIPALRRCGIGRKRTAMNWITNDFDQGIIAYRLSRISDEETAAGELTDGTKIRMLTEHDPTPVADLTMDAPGYELLADVLMKAYLQASDGKGRDRHAGDDLKPFSEQPIMTIQQMVGPGFTLGQAIKKIEESQRMNLDAACAELLGAVIYIAAAIGYLEKQMK